MNTAPQSDTPDLQEPEQSEPIQPMENWVSRLVRKRYGVGILLLLVGWTFAGYLSLFESTLVNGLLLDTYFQLGIVTAINVNAIVFSIAAIRLLNQRIPGRFLQAVFGDGNGGWGVRLGLIASALAIVTPSILAASFASEYAPSMLPHWLAASIAVGLGLAAGWVFLLVLGKVKSFLVGCAADAAYFPFETDGGAAVLFQVGVLQSLFRGLSYIGSRLGLENSDYQFLAYLFILAVSHWVTAFSFATSETWWITAPCMVIILAWIVGMTLTGLANLMDQFRFPVVALLLVMITLLQIPSGSTRDIKTVVDHSGSKFTDRVAAVVVAEEEFLEANQAGESRGAVVNRKTVSMNQDAWNAIVDRMNQPSDGEPGKGRTLVVVTCPGGGIHAAAWAACVLEQISREYSDFSGSVCVISAVSGGSVGTLYFVSKEYHEPLTGDDSAWPPPELTQGMPQTEDIPPGSALDLATRSSLEPIAYGMVTDDLYGIFYHGLSRRDRGQRLEDSLTRRLPENQRRLSMGQWGDVALTGKMPIVVFNATDAATGRRVLFDSVPTPRRPSNVGQAARPINYRELLLNDGESLDVKPATAARVSATFPYISPFTKPDVASQLGNNIALADGGYADNEGIVSAVNWIEFLLTKWSDVKDPSKRPFDRILLLRIQPSPVQDAGQVVSDSFLTRSFRWLVGPAETMVNVRSTSQTERGNLESDLASAYQDMAANAGGPSNNPGKLKTSFSKLQNLPADFRSPDAIRQKQSTPESQREDWQRQIKEFQATVKNDKNWLRRLAPELETQMVTSQQDTIYPVTVRTVPFKNFNQVIPLNWKLSHVQKLWYPYAWKLASEADTPLRKTLDQFFTRRKP